jgi:MFS family permease
MTSIYLAAHIPGGTPDTSGKSSLQSHRDLLIPLRDRRFLRYLGGLGLVTLATAPVFAFLPLYMQEKVGLSPGSVVFLQTGGLIGSVLSSYFWGWLADRYGSKPITLSGLLLISTLPLWWYLTPREAPLSLPIALAIALLQGVAGSGWGIGSGRLLFVNMVPAENKASYLSQYNAWMGLIGGFSAIFGGRLLDVFSELQGQFLGLQVDAFTILFAIGFLLPLLSVFILRSIQTEREMGISQFAGLFIHGNPLLAVDSLIRFYFAREEPAVVAVTELLGKSRSPLTVNELMESLDDPRFYVRFEALVSIARHSPDERLVHALVEVLEGNDPALSMMAAWALGRIGNGSALPALRHSLQASRYRSVRAHVARSLGSLGDTDSIALLLDAVREETDMGLKVAFASALGKLKAIQAAPDLLDILYRDRYPSSQKEMGLSLARLLDAETAYIQLARSLLADPGTALAQQVENLRRSLNRRFPEQEDLILQFESAVVLFARGELEMGLQEFSTAVKSLPMDKLPSHFRQIFAECITRMQEFGFERTEYIILVNLVLEKH